MSNSTIFIRNLPFRVSESELREVIEKYFAEYNSANGTNLTIAEDEKKIDDRGERTYSAVFILKERTVDPRTGEPRTRSRGMAFVKLADASMIQDAVKALNEKEITEQGFDRDGNEKQPRPMFVEEKRAEGTN